MPGIGLILGKIIAFMTCEQLEEAETLLHNTNISLLISIFQAYPAFLHDSRVEAYNRTSHLLESSLLHHLVHF